MDYNLAEVSSHLYTILISSRPRPFPLSPADHEFDAKYKVEKLGAGTFGQVFKVNNNLVAKAIMLSPDAGYDMLDDFNKEVGFIEEIAAIPELKNNVPLYLGKYIYTYHRTNPEEEEAAAAEARTKLGPVALLWQCENCFHPNKADAVRCAGCGRVKTVRGGAATAASSPGIKIGYHTAVTGLQVPNTVAFIFQKYEKVTTVASFIADYKVYRRNLSVKEAKRYFDNTVRAIRTFHRHGFLHRDIKPANMLFRVDDGPLHYEPIIIDFGLICKIPCKEDDRVVGTPMYLPLNYQNALRRMTMGKRQVFNVAMKKKHSIGERLKYWFSRKLGAPSNRPIKPKARKVFVHQATDELLPKYSKHIDEYALGVSLEQFLTIVQESHDSDYENMKNTIIQLKRGVLSDLAARAAKVAAVRRSVVDPSVPAPLAGQYSDGGEVGPTVGSGKKRRSKTRKMRRN